MYREMKPYEEFRIIILPHHRDVDILFRNPAILVVNNSEFPTLVRKARAETMLASRTCHKILARFEECRGVVGEEL